MGRLELLERLAARLGGSVETFAFPSKVPVPSGLSPAATIALIQDIARHHQAELRSVSPDYRFFYLAHRAGRLRGGALELAVVHDNTLAGGERVAELVTAPLWRADLGGLRAALEVIGAIDGVTTPDTAALHVHLDGAPFLEARPLSRLIALFSRLEPALRVLTRTPPGLRRAAPLPPALGAELRSELAWAEVEALLRREIEHRGYALNLYNLIAGDPQKLTVELKLAGATIDPARVVAIRELYVRIALAALGEGSLELPTEAEALAPELG